MDCYNDAERDPFAIAAVLVLKTTHFKRNKVAVISSRHILCVSVIADAQLALEHARRQRGRYFTDLFLLIVVVSRRTTL